MRKRRKKLEKKLASFLLAASCLVTSVCGPNIGYGNWIAHAEETQPTQTSPQIEYLYFHDGEQVGTGTDANGTNIASEYDGCVEVKTEETTVTVTPHAKEGYEFAILNLVSNEPDQTKADVFTPLSRDYVKAGTGNQLISENETPAYTFTVSSGAIYANGTTYDTMPKMNVYFDSKKDELNQRLLNTYSSGDNNAIVEGWLTGKISAGAEKDWGGQDTNNSNLQAVYDAGEGNYFEITDAVLYGRFQWSGPGNNCRLDGIHIQVSNDGSTYTDVITPLASKDTFSVTETGRLAKDDTEPAIGQYLRLYSQWSLKDISYARICGTVKSNSSTGEGGESGGATDPETPVKTEYRYFKGGDEVDKGTDAPGTNVTADYDGYVEVKTEGTKVTVTPHAKDGYEFAILNLVSKEPSLTTQEQDVFTPLSRDYVRSNKDDNYDADIGSNSQHNGDASYYFEVSESATYKNGDYYTVMPELHAYFDSVANKLNDSLSDCRKDDNNTTVEGWLTGKISAGGNPWAGADTTADSTAVFDAGAKKAFQITDAVLYGRFRWSDTRFDGISIQISDDGTNYTNILTTANRGLNEKFSTARAQMTSGQIYTGRYLRLYSNWKTKDISYAAVYGTVIDNCEKLSILKKTVEQYQSLYEGGNSAGYDVNKWSAFASAYENAKSLADGTHEESDKADQKLENAKTALESAYQALIESKAQTLEYRSFKDGALVETVGDPKDFTDQYDGYVKVYRAENGEDLTLTPVAADGHEFSLMTVEELNEDKTVVRSLSPISKDYRRANADNKEESQRITDGKYDVTLKIASESGGEGSFTFSEIPQIKAYFDVNAGTINEQMLRNVKENKNAMQALLAGGIHAGGNKWEKMYPEDTFLETGKTDKYQTWGKDLKTDDFATFYAGEGKQFTITEVVIYGRANWADSRFDGLVLEVSNDGENFTELLKTEKTYPENCKWETPRKTYRDTIYARYVRIRSTRNELNISRINFYGTIEEDKTDYYALKQACEKAAGVEALGQSKPGEWCYTNKTWTEFTSAYNAANDLLTQWEDESAENPNSATTVAATERLLASMENLAEALPSFIQSVRTQLSHPAIGNSAADLIRLRNHVIAGDEPWASYFKEFSKNELVSKDYRIRNDKNLDSDVLTPVYGYKDYATNLFNGDMKSDAKAAYYQTVMYFMTGDVEYREKAMRILRLWSILDPSEAAYANDAHIHHSNPTYYFNCAAELLRYTTTTRADLEWTETDTNNYITNYLKPALDEQKGWFIKKTNWFNQHQTVVMARLSSMIFMDDKAGYDETVEWLTVNSGTDSANAYHNGSIKNAFPELTKQQDGTETASYVAVAEMVRDQPHSGENVTGLMMCARMLAAQGTKVDPDAGTVSNASDAEDIYSFLDDRLIKGANYWCQYNLGYEDMKFYDSKAGTETKLSDYARGRIWDITEYYMYYKYVKNYEDADPNFKYVAEEYEYIRNVYGNYRNEDWMYIPERAAGEFKCVPKKERGTTYQFEEQANWFEDTVKLSEDDTAIEVTASESGTPFAMLDFYKDKDGKVAITYKSNGLATMEICRYKDSDAIITVVLPDTNDELKTIVYDPTGESSYISNQIFYFRVKGANGTTVAFDSMEVTTKTTPASYEGGRQERIVYFYPNMPLESNNAVSGAQTVTYKLQGDVPEGLTVDKNGKLSWNVPADTNDAYDCYLIADASGVLSVLKVDLKKQSDYLSIVKAFAAGYQDNEVYESATKKAFDTAYENAKNAESSDSTQQQEALLALEKAVAGLRLLNPKLSDGTLDYTDLVTGYYGNNENSKSLQAAIPLLADNDLVTYSTDVWDKAGRCIIYDFGENFRFKATAFRFAPRETFTGRTENITVFGSNDMKSWVALTDATRYDDGFQTVPVYAEQQDKQYRYFMTKQLPIGPRHPMSYAEFRMEGARVELEAVISNISIASDDYVTGNWEANGNTYNPKAYRADKGKTITLTFDAKRALDELNVTIEGQTAAVTAEKQNDDSYKCSAAVTLDHSAGEAHNAEFGISYKQDDGTQSEPIQVTSDGSRVMVSDQSNLITDVMSYAKSEVKDARNVFDDNMGTWPNLGVHDKITLDFGDNRVQLERIEILPRYDFNDRLMRFYLEASEDGEHWRNITRTFWEYTTSWASLPVFPYDQGKSYRYLRLSGSGWYGNVAEVCLYGECGPSLTEENLKTYTVTATPNISGAGTCQVYYEGQPAGASNSLSGIKGGEAVSINAIPADGYKFVRWVQKKEFCGVTYDYYFAKESTPENTLQYAQGEYQGGTWYEEVIEDMDIIAVFEKTDGDTECKHTVTKTEGKPATCKEEGNITYWHCSDCGKYFSDAELKTEITEADTKLAKDPANHTGGTYVKNQSEATETTEGYTGDKHCSGCDALLEQGTVIPKKESGNTGGSTGESGSSSDSSTGSGSSGGPSASADDKTDASKDEQKDKEVTVTENPDGSKKEVVKEQKVNSKGNEVTVTTTTTTDSDGKVTGVTEKTRIDSIAPNTSVSVTVKTDDKGKVTNATATISKNVPKNGKKATIFADVIEQIKEAAGTDVNVTMNVKTADGETKYKVKVDTADLQAGNSLYIYQLNTKTGEYTMVNSKTYSVNKKGNVSVSMDAKATYELLSEQKAKQVEKQILSTVKVKNSKASVKKGKKTAVSFSAKLNMKNVENITYSTSQKSVATVSKTGLVRTKKVGTVTIHATVTLKNGAKKTVKMKITVK